MLLKFPVFSSFTKIRAKVGFFSSWHGHELELVSRVRQPSLDFGNDNAMQHV